MSKSKTLTNTNKKQKNNNMKPNKPTKHCVDPNQKLIKVCIAEGIESQKQTMRYRPTQRDNENGKKIAKEIDDAKKEVLENLNLVPDLLSLYVDDQCIVGEPPPEG